MLDAVPVKNTPEGIMTIFDPSPSEISPAFSIVPVTVRVIPAEIARIAPTAMDTVVELPSPTLVSAVTVTVWGL